MIVTRQVGFTTQADQLWGLVDAAPSQPAPFDSWWWRNRVWLSLGTLGLFGAGVLLLSGKVLR